MLVNHNENTIDTKLKQESVPLETGYRNWRDHGQASGVCIPISSFISEPCCILYLKINGLVMMIRQHVFQHQSALNVTTRTGIQFKLLLSMRGLHNALNSIISQLFFKQ